MQKVKVMRYKIYILSILFISFLTGCEDGLEEKVKFDMTVVSEGSSMIKDTIVVKKSTDVQFNFSGNPDFITFYSGESGHVYSKRNLTESPIDKINSKLEFSVKTQYGNAATVAGSLKVFLSNEFEGLYKNDKQRDSISVETTKWVDVTEECGIPQKVGITSGVLTLSLNEYLGNRLALAFLYSPKDNSQAQPVWEIYNLKIINTDKETGETEGRIQTKDFGFTPLDMYAVTNAYKTVTDNTEGVWNTSKAISDPSTIRIHSSSTGKPLHKDWLISNPIIINARTPDGGVGIKTITNRLDSYTHQYDKAGVYTITMIGRNNNFEAASEVIREVVIKVVE